MNKWFWIIIVVAAVLVAAYVINNQVKKRKESETESNGTESSQTYEIPDTFTVSEEAQSKNITFS